MAPLTNCRIFISQFSNNNVGGPDGQLSRFSKSLVKYATEELDNAIYSDPQFTPHLTQVLTILERNSPRLILNMSSAGSIGLPYFSIYSSCKGHENSFTR